MKTPTLWLRSGAQWNRVPSRCRVPLFLNLGLLLRKLAARSMSSKVAKTAWSQDGITKSHNLDFKASALMSRPAEKQYQAYIALGSNMGDRIAMIERACNEMNKREIKIKRTSCLWETEPMYVTNQAKFLNGACEVETTLQPLALLDQLQDIENLMGREKLVEKGPRNIDLDILLYEDEIIDHDRLKIPHPLMYDREFVLRPLAENMHLLKISRLIPAKALDTRLPWKVTQDYLNSLPPSAPPMSTLTPLSPTSPPLHVFRTNCRTKIMGILNMTPDSLSSSVLASSTPSMTESSLLNAIEARSLQEASIIDIGGQSTAPASTPLSPRNELARIIPAIKAVKQHYPHIPISIDTYNSSVAARAIALGADIINDISAGVLDPVMLSTIASAGKTVILMHMRGTPSTMTSPQHSSYPNHSLIPSVASELLARVEAAQDAGIPRWRIILDPGIGFAKNAPQNIEILRRLSDLRNWPGLRGLPWVVGSSNKRFVGRYAGLGKDASVAERRWGTAATVAAAVQGGADVVRVHDVKEMGMVVGVADAIWRA